MDPAEQARRYPQAKGPIRDPSQPRRLTITKEGSDWGHVIRDMILPATGIGAMYAAPAIIGSQALSGAGAGGSAVPGSISPAVASTLGAAPTTSAALGGGTSALAGAGSIAGSTTAQTIAGAGYAGGGGTAGTIGSILGKARPVAAGLGAISSGQAHNRGEEFGGQLDLAAAQVLREQENRAGGLDAWRKLLMAQRTLSPGPRPQLSPYSIAPRQATGEELSGANAMTREVMARLHGGPTPLNVDPRLLRPGRTERALGYAAPILEGLGSYFGGRY